MTRHLGTITDAERENLFATIEAWLTCAGFAGGSMADEFDIWTALERELKHARLGLQWRELRDWRDRLERP